MCKYYACKGTPTATVMCKHLTFTGAPTAIVMCKDIAFKWAPNSNCNVKFLTFRRPQLELQITWNFFKEICFSKRYSGLLSCASAGGGVKRAFAPPLEIGTKKPKFLENLKSASWFRLIDLIIAITLDLPAWHSHCIRASFSLVVWRSDELAVHSWPLLR